MLKTLQHKPSSPLDYVKPIPTDEIVSKIAEVLPALKIGFAWEISENKSQPCRFSNRFIIRLFYITENKQELMGSCLFNSMSPGEVGRAAEIVLKGKNFQNGRRNVTQKDETGLGFYTT